MNDNDIRMQDASETIGDVEAADTLESCRKQLNELRQQHLRALADARNIAQRAARENAEAVKYAVSDFARDLLVVIDDLDRTLASAQTGADAVALADGVRITQEHFSKLLAARGIQAIDAVGKPFDPSLHEAVLQQPSNDVPAGSVLQEAARGYRIHDRVLRPARVIVSSGRNS